MSAYGWVILCSFIGPLALSFDQKVAFYKVWRYLIPSILIVGIGFLLWDEVFTRMGVWGFNPRYLFGVYLGRLPLEEVLFFLVVPYNFIFILLVLQAYFPNRKTEMIQRIFTWTMGISSLLMVLFHGGGQLFFSTLKTYNYYTISAAAMAFILTKLRSSLKRLSKTQKSPLTCFAQSFLESRVHIFS